MSVKTFPRGGVHPPEHKEATAGSPIREIPPARDTVIPLSQHTGAPCQATVSVGDRVLAGQKVGDVQAFISAPVHASASGTVKAIEPRRTFTGAMVMSVVIATDENQKSVDPAEPRDWRALSPDEIRTIVRGAGIVGLGGAAFPASVKLAPPKDKKVDAVIVNGCECEPFLTCDHALMLARPDDLIEAARLLIKAVGATTGRIGIEVNKPDAIELLESKLKDDPEVAVVRCQVKYPEGAEKQLIKTVLDREVPPGKLPSEVGALVHNVGTALAILDAVREGKALTRRVLTVTGAVKNPSNVMAAIGTPVGHIIEQCGGFSEEPGKVVLGGPMTGWAIDDLNTPIQKGTSGIVVLTRKHVDLNPALACVRCGKCVEVCPMGLMPNMIGIYGEKGKWDDAERWNAMDCFECGACAYVCPSKRPTIDWVRQAKRQINEKRRQQREATKS